MELVQVFPMGGLGDPAPQSRRFTLFETVKQSPLGYRYCMHLLTDGSTQDDFVVAFCLTVVENHIRTSILHFSKIRLFLIEVIRAYCRHRPHSERVKRLLAKVFAAAFVKMYPEPWRNFFPEILSTLWLGSRAVEHFLRMLLNIRRELDISGRGPGTVRRADVRLLGLACCWAIKDHPELAWLALRAIHHCVLWMDSTLALSDEFTSSLCEATAIAASTTDSRISPTLVKALSEYLNQSEAKLARELKDALEPLPN